MVAVLDVPVLEPVKPHGRRRLGWGTPFAYLAAILVTGVTVVPLLFVVVGGFRTTAQINANPSGLPSPWVLDNYRAIIISPAFWNFLANSALIAAIATALAVVL